MVNNMSEIYQVLFKSNIETNGVGYVIEGDVHFRLPNEGKVNDWKPIVVEVRDGDYCDYLACNIGGRICSKKLRDIINQNASTHDDLQWLDLSAIKNGEKQVYYMLHFPYPPDVLNIDRTLFVKNTDIVVRPVFSRIRCESFNVISFYENMGVSWYIRDFVKKAIQAAGCTGIEFSQARVV
jgi:hypothetical protein